MEITEDFIARYAGNPSTVSNARAVTKNGAFTLHETEDGALLFGTCKGGGSSAYNCSVDFSDQAQPIARCTCPSRQTPCKHAVALLIHKMDGDKFTIEPIPEDVAAKREKKAQKESKAAVSAPAAITKPKAAAAAKKCMAQLEGLGMAEKILGNIIRSGLHCVDRETHDLYASQVKELGNYYISGVQSAFADFLAEAAKGQLNQSFTAAIERSNYIYALLKRAKPYLENKMSDYLAFPETPNTALELMTSSTIEEQLGYAWKLTELREKGLYINNAQLLQLSFDSYDDSAHKQAVDEGVWMVLNTGAIVCTYNYRPYKALKNINPQDSCFRLLKIEDLYIYPGDKNPRVRWGKETGADPAGEGSYEKALSYARGDFAQVIKEVKSQIISPLADKRPIYALRPALMLKTGDPANFVIADASGGKISIHLEKFGYLLKMASRSQIEGGALTCRFAYDIAADLLYAVPLSLLTGGGVVRFFY